MRKFLPAMAAAIALFVGLAPAAAQDEPSKHHERSRSHVSLHLSTHSVLKGRGLAVRGKVRPSGRHRVKLVFRGPDGGARGVTTKANGTFAVRWLTERTGTTPKLFMSCFATNPPTNPISLEAPFRGTFVAPNASVNFASLAAPGFTGAFFAKDIIVQPNQTITFIAHSGTPPLGSI